MGAPPLRHALRAARTCPAVAIHRYTSLYNTHQPNSAPPGTGDANASNYLDVHIQHFTSPWRHNIITFSGPLYPYMPDLDGAGQLLTSSWSCSGGGTYLYPHVGTSFSNGGPPDSLFLVCPPGDTVWLRLPDYGWSGPEVHFPLPPTPPEGGSVCLRFDSSYSFVGTGACN